jgi:hypothetical protein
MANIKIKRGAGIPSGLTFGELAFDATNKRLYIGITGGNALLANTDGGVASFNGLTGAVTGVTTGTANTFGPLQSFTNGISSAGGTFSALTRFTAGISASGATFSGNISTETLRVGSGVTYAAIYSNAYESFLEGYGSNLRIRHATGKYITIGDNSATGSIGNGTHILVSDNDASITLYAQLVWTRSPSLFQYYATFDEYIDLKGGLKISGDQGTNGKVLTSTGSGITWASASSGVSSVTGSGNGISVSPTTGAVVVQNTGVHSFNGLTGAVTGVTLGGAAFTGLVSSTVGFSGSATNLVGNANGLTAGTASRVQIAEGAGSSYYLALAGGTGNTGIFVDTSVPRWNYNASTGALTTSTGYVEAATLYATTAIYSNTLEGFDGTSPLNIVAPYFDGTNQPMYIGDTNGSQNGTLITIDDAASKIEFFATDINALGSLNVKNSGYLTFYDADVSNYVAFRGATALGANTLWTLPSADGSANQVLTTNGSGTLSWSTPSGGGSVTSVEGMTGDVVLPAINLYYFNIGII